MCFTLPHTGRLPESIGKLHMLSTLNVFHNDLNGNIPAAIGNLASLTSLSMGSNRFRGACQLLPGALVSDSLHYLGETAGCTVE